MDHATLANTWRAHMQYLGHSPNTIERRMFTVRKWWSYTAATGGNPTATHVETFLAQWSNTATRRAFLGDLRAYYGWSVRARIEHDDPTLDVTSPRVRRRRPTPVTAEDVRRLLATNRAPRRTMIALAALAGLRVSEIAALHTDDVDLADGLLAVRDGKGGKDRFVPISPQLASELAGWPTGRYFPGITGDGVSNRIRTALHRLDINRRPHDLRAAFATQLARTTNGNLVLVAQLMGHESISTTQMYVDWSPEGAAAVARLFVA